MNNFTNMKEELNVLEKPKNKEKTNDVDINMLNLKKDILKSNSLLNYIWILEKSPLFETISLKKWELIFDEWSMDNNLYIIKKWILSVEKYTTNQREETKQLAILKTWDFFWEASLSWVNAPKEALIKALEDSEVLSINSQTDLKKFIEENPNIWYEVLKHIITQTNARLLEVNKLLTTNYEVEKQIKWLTNIDLKNIFWLIDNIKNIADVDYIIYIEKHQILDNFFTIKYDSRQPNKMLDKVIEKKWNFLDLDELYSEANISKDDFLSINRLSIGNDIYWYLIFWREKRSFSWSDKKVFSSISNSFVWVLQKFFSDKEQLNKLYISQQKK